MAQTRVTKQWLQKQFQSSGIQAEPAALTKLAQVLDQAEDPENLLHSVLDAIETNEDSRKVTVAFLDKFISILEDQRGKGGLIQVISAFDAPLILYDPIRKLFHHHSEGRKLFADAQSKIQLYVDRFLLVQQRLRRNKLFRPSQFNSIGGGTAAAGGPRQDVAELTELKALLGLIGERRFVTGFLTLQDEGRYYIEDLSARLPLDLASAETADGMFTENCIVVAEGELTPGGAFRAAALGLPPAEPRAESLSALQGLDFFGGTRPDGRTAAETDRVVILSDVHLDRPDVLDKLHTIFGGFSSLEEPPSMFVLMGNFQSYDANAADISFARVRDNFATLGRIISQYPRLRTDSSFLLVPGPGDVGPGDMLPRPTLPRSVVQPLLDAVPSIVLGTNPCRIRHGTAELVLFRANMQRKMRGLSILPSAAVEAADAAGDAAAAFDSLCGTVLQESHLCPVPLEYQPIVWELDHSLWLYPMPHGLVMADAEPAARSVFDTCACLNPGSLVEGTFGAWAPAANEMELCDVSAAAVMDGDDDSDGSDASEPEVDITSDGEAVEDVLEDPDPVPAILMKRQFDAVGDPAGAPQNKEHKPTLTAPGPVKHRRAVPPGYLHDLLHTRHLMKSVGLRGPPTQNTASKNVHSSVAVTSGRIAALARPQGPFNKAAGIPTHTLPSLFEHRKRFLQTKRRKERGQTPYQQHPDKPVGLLSLPEDVMLRIVCKLQHDDIKPLFRVCKQLTNTLQNAIRFHFNYATPYRAIAEEPTPGLKRPDRKRAVTALADVMAHLKRGQRNVAAARMLSNPPDSAQSTGPRTLSFTPQATPLGRQTPLVRGQTPLARQQTQTPSGR